MNITERLERKAKAHRRNRRMEMDMQDFDETIDFYLSYGSRSNFSQGYDEFEDELANY